MVVAIVLTMVEMVTCHNFGNASREYEALASILERQVKADIKRVGRQLGVVMKARYSKDDCINAILNEKYGKGLSAPSFDGAMTQTSFKDLDPSLKVDGEGHFVSADGILNVQAPMGDKIKSPYQRASSYDYMIGTNQISKNRVVLNGEGLPVSRRWSASIKVPLLNPIDGQFKTLKSGRIKLVRCELRVNKLVAHVNSEDRYNGRVKTGSSNLRHATVLRQVILENEEGSYLVWVAILQSQANHINSITLPNMVTPAQVTKALDSIKKSWRFAAGVKVASEPSGPICEAYSSIDSSCTIDAPHQCVEGETTEPMLESLISHKQHQAISHEMTKEERMAHINDIQKANKAFGGQTYCPLPKRLLDLMYRGGE